MKPTESTKKHIKTLTQLYTVWFSIYSIYTITQLYVKFLSWKVAQNVVTSITSANIAIKLNIFATQKYSKKFQGKMNSQLLKYKEFKLDKDKKLSEIAMLSSQGC